MGAFQTVSHTSIKMTFQTYRMFAMLLLGAVAVSAAKKCRWCDTRHTAMTPVTRNADGQYYCRGCRPAEQNTARTGYCHANGISVINSRKDDDNRTRKDLDDNNHARADGTY